MYVCLTNVDLVNCTMLNKKYRTVGNGLFSNIKRDAIAREKSDGRALSNDGSQRPLNAYTYLFIRRLFYKKVGVQVQKNRKSRASTLRP